MRCEVSARNQESKGVIATSNPQSILELGLQISRMLAVHQVPPCSASLTGKSGELRSMCSCFIEFSEDILPDLGLVVPFQLSLGLHGMRPGPFSIDERHL